MVFILTNRLRGMKDGGRGDGKGEEMVELIKKPRFSLFSNLLEVLTLSLCRRIDFLISRNEKR